MKYKSILYLKKVVYSGDNIGRNFSLSFRLDDKTKDINVALSNGQTKFFNKNLFETFLSRPHKATLSVHIIEKDKYSDAPQIWNKIFETLTWCRAKKGYIGEVEVINKMLSRC